MSSVDFWAGLAPGEDGSVFPFERVLNRALNEWVSYGTGFSRSFDETSNHFDHNELVDAGDGSQQTNTTWVPLQDKKIANKYYSHDSISVWRRCERPECAPGGSAGSDEWRTTSCPPEYGRCPGGPGCSPIVDEANAENSHCSSMQCDQRHHNAGALSGFQDACVKHRDTFVDIGCSEQVKTCPRSCGIMSWVCSSRAVVEVLQRSLHTLYAAGCMHHGATRTWPPLYAMLYKFLLYVLSHAFGQLCRITIFLCLSFPPPVGLRHLRAGVPYPDGGRQSALPALQHAFVFWT